MSIRHAFPADLDAIASLEAACFPPAEAAACESIRARIDAFGDRFWLLEENGRLISFINGMLTDEDDLRDQMFDEASLHDPEGAWQMLFSVATDPAEQGKGHATRLLKQVIVDCLREGRAGIVLTCKEHKIRLYHRVGFVNEGVSQSEHGGALWYRMRLCLDGPVFTVKRVLEDDFGCEGLPEDEEKQVTLLCEAPDQTILRIRMQDDLAMERGLDEGMRVLLLQDGTLIPVT